MQSWQVMVMVGDEAVLLQFKQKGLYTLQGWQIELLSITYVG